MDGGKGAVDGTYKNVPLTGASGSTGESVTAVRHANKKDFWIIAPGRGTSTYLNVWKVTSAGVQAARHSVISVPGSTVATTACGYLRSSPNGKNVAWACGNEEVVTEKIKTLDVKISSCSLPVNHNISVMEY